MSNQSPNEDSLTTEYVESEKVLAYHGALLYEAKVLKVDHKEDPVTHVRKPLFFLHYQGWNDRWDEWVESNRILKYNDENKKIQEDLRNEHKKISTKRTKGPGEMKSKKRKLAQEKAVDPKYKIEIPLPLKNKLIDDYQSIVSQKYLVVLPRQPTVVDILRSYIEFIQQSNNNVVSNPNSASSPLVSNQPETVNSEVVLGLRAYFDKSIGTLLLYKFERHQYSEILKRFPNKDMAEVYGVEHLARLIVKLPQLLSEVALEDEALQTVKNTAADLAKFINKNLAIWSPPGVYQPATVQYIKESS